MGRQAALRRASRSRASWILWALLGACAGLAVAQEPPAPADGEKPEDAPGSAAEKDDQAEEVRPPGPQAPVSGMSSLVARSHLEFPGLPDQPHVLDATYAFPERARWRIAPRPKPTAPGKRQSAEVRRQDRRMRFRWGDGVWAVEPGETGSRRFEGEDRRLALLRIEMRRVALMWPAELEWKGEGAERVALLPGVGQYVAWLDPEHGRPVRLESRDADGTPRERFEAITWRAEGERHWPQAWELWSGENLIWKEQIGSVRTARKLQDPFFLPGDQRQGRVTNVKALNRLQVDEVQVPRFRAWRRRLEKDEQDWEKAVEIGRLELGNWSKAFEGTRYRLDDRPYFYVDQGCKPFLLEVRLLNELDDPPPEWILQGGYPALRSAFDSVDKLTPTNLSRIRSRVPQDLSGGGPYAAVQLTEGGTGIVQLVLPTNWKVVDDD